MNQLDSQWVIRSTSSKPDFIKAALIKNLALEQYDFGPNTKAYLFPTCTHLVNNGNLDKILNTVLFSYNLGIGHSRTDKKIALWIKLRREIYKKINEDLISKDLNAFVKSDNEIEELIKRECQIYLKYKRFGNLRNVYLITFSDSDLETNIAGRLCQIRKGTSIYKLEKVKN